MTAETMTTTTAARGAAEQFEAIFARYHSSIRRLFYGWLEDWHEADEQTSELFATLWRDMSQRGLVLDDGDRFFSFLATRARWARHAYYRARAIRARELSMHVDDVADDKSWIEARAAALCPDYDPAATVPTQVDIERVLAQLPEAQRRALVERYLNDRSILETAAAAGWGKNKTSETTAAALDAVRKLAGVEPGERRTASTQERHAQLRAAYLAAIEADQPLSFAELGRRFNMGKAAARMACRDLERPEPRVTTTERLTEAVRALVADGSIPPGQQLPGVKVMAAMYETHTGNVTHALQKLVAAGEIEARPMAVAGRHTYHVPARATRVRHLAVAA